MTYRIVYHQKAEAELDALYEQIAERAGLVIAGNYVDGIHDFIEKLRIFPQRGTVRESGVRDLRIIGYRRSVSIAFVVREDVVSIMGVFSRGRNISRAELEERG